MKKVIAFLLAVLYFVFTTFTLSQVNNGDHRFLHTASELHQSAVATADDGLEKAMTIDILAAKSISKPPKHLSVFGKTKLPRASSLAPSSRNFFSFSTTSYHKLDISMATRLLYHASIYLKNGVLRI